jgi:hypothetical protein
MTEEAGKGAFFLNNTLRAQGKKYQYQPCNNNETPKKNHLFDDPYSARTAI